MPCEICGEFCDSLEHYQTIMGGQAEWDALFAREAAARRAADSEVRIDQLIGKSARGRRSRRR